MCNGPSPPNIDDEPLLMLALGWYVIVGRIVCATSVLVADFYHTRLRRDNRYDQGAGRYEFIVDTGIYSFSASLIYITLFVALAHMGVKRWDYGLGADGVHRIFTGARNKYGNILVGASIV